MYVYVYITLKSTSKQYSFAAHKEAIETTKEGQNRKERERKGKALKTTMDKAVCLYASLGLFAGSFFSSCISGTPRCFGAEQDCYLSSSIGKYLSSLLETIYICFLIVALKVLGGNQVLSSSAPSYTMTMPFWVAFTLSITYMSQFSLT